MGTLPVRMPAIDPLVFVLLRFPDEPAPELEGTPAPAPFFPTDAPPAPPCPPAGAMGAFAPPLPPIEARPLASARCAPLARFLFLITSVLSDSGRTTPCSLRNRPHALHSGWPSGSRRHRGVLVVLQLEHTVGGSAVAIELADGRSLRLTPEPEPDADPEPGPETDRTCTPFELPGAEPGPPGIRRDASLNAAAFWIACMLGDAFEREDPDPAVSGAS